jgi:hypothetical protein
MPWFESLWTNVGIPLQRATGLGMDGQPRDLARFDSLLVILNFSILFRLKNVSVKISILSTMTTL